LGRSGRRSVAIDHDWSALRFRRMEFIKAMSREKHATTTQGNTRTGQK
jgi:hypothetical protein